MNIDQHDLQDAGSITQPVLDGFFAPVEADKAPVGIHLQGHGQLSQFLMNFPGDQFPFIFPGILQVIGQIFQPLVLPLQQFLFPLPFRNIP